MQIYRGMDIGTAKPGPEERRLVPHHLIDIAEIEEPFSLALFLSQAEAAIEEIHGRGRLPILVGGTGLYIEYLLSGWRLPEMGASQAVRERLYARAKDEGAAALHARLREIDPEAAAAIHPNNVKRVVRAIEIYELTGRTKTELDARSRAAESRFAAEVVLLEAPREKLYARIGRRVDAMRAAGLPEEVRALCARGLRTAPTASQAIGYKEFYPYFDGACGLDAAVEAVKQSTRRYAKRQCTYFSRMHVDTVVAVEQ